MDIKRKHYICSHCGYSPFSRSTWCDLGCGSDWNQMIEVSPQEARKLFMIKHGESLRLRIKESRDSDEG